MKNIVSFINSFDLGMTVTNLIFFPHKTRKSFECNLSHLHWERTLTLWNDVAHCFRVLVYGVIGILLMKNILLIYLKSGAWHNSWWQGHKGIVLRCWSWLNVNPNFPHKALFKKNKFLTQELKKQVSLSGLFLEISLTPYNKHFIGITQISLTQPQILSLIMLKLLNHKLTHHTYTNISITIS